MDFSSLVRLVNHGISTLFFRRGRPVLSTLIIGDSDAGDYRSARIERELEFLRRKGLRTVFFYGDDAVTWRDGAKDVSHLTKRAKELGFSTVAVVTSGVHLLPHTGADFILLRLFGKRQRQNKHIANSYDEILYNVARAKMENIILNMSIDKQNMSDISHLCNLVEVLKPVKAVSYGFYDAVSGSDNLELSGEERQWCCEVIESLWGRGGRILNAKRILGHMAKKEYAPGQGQVLMKNGAVIFPERHFASVGDTDAGSFFSAEASLISDRNLMAAWEIICSYIGLL